MVSVHSEGPAATATPLWFGPPDRPLFGWLHLPADRGVRGGVVLCQPLGIEAICVYFTYRLVAEALAERGLAVLRFDYDGTGDSSGGETDPDRLEDWLASVAAATDRMAETGVTAIGMVGLRMGGLFVPHEASRRGGIDALALWDPCLSGSSFLREQRFLRTLSGSGSDPDDAVEAPGLRFEPETVKALADLDLKGLPGSLAQRALVLIPRSCPSPAPWSGDSRGPTWSGRRRPARIACSTPGSRPPRSTPSGAWPTGCPTPSWDGDRDPPESASAVVSPGPAGAPVTERTVSLGRLGLFGIVTEPAGPVHGPTVVLVNEGNTHHIGQARIWVDLARRLAPAGFRVLRFDLSGNGDSGLRPGQQAHVSRAPEAIADVYEAMEGIAPDDPTEVVLVGFCSGAYQVIEQALAHPPRGICVINPLFSFCPPSPPGRRPGRPARCPSAGWPLCRRSPPLVRRPPGIGGAGWPAPSRSGPGRWPWPGATRGPLMGVGSGPPDPVGQHRHRHH